MKFVAKAQESRERDANMMMRGFVKIQTAKVLCLRLQCLERIRADVLKFMTGTEGQVNKMSDDLISRKAVIDTIENIISEVEVGLTECLLKEARVRIEQLDTAFDKEKIIEELKSWEKASHDAGIQSTYAELDNKASGYYQESRAYHRAIEIVEKGGIE